MKTRYRDLIVEVPISSLSKKGNGRGEFVLIEGELRSCEVPFSLPEDIVKARLRDRKRGMFSSFLEEVVTPSPHRVTPRCIHFGSCGGCRWQHLSYPQQLIEKERRVHEALQGYTSVTTTWHPIIACTPPWHYRNKMEFSFSANKAGEKFLGLMLDSSKGKVLNLTECHLVNPWFIEGLKAVRKWWESSTLEAYHPFKDSGSLRTLTMREGMRTGDRMVILTVSGNPDFALKQQDVKAFQEALKESIGQQLPHEGKLSIFLKIHQIAKGKPTQFFEMLLYGPDVLREKMSLQITETGKAEEFTFKISPAAFFQPSTAQAEKLYSAALRLASIQKNSVVYDLYCGTGTLSLCASLYAREVVGIELSPEAVLDARENAKSMKVEHVAFYQGDVGEILKKLKEEKKHPAPDCVLIDPPRAGLNEEALKHIQELGAPTLVYVSCHPATQAENIKHLIQSGYRVTDVQPVDQFPHTPHIENIAILKKG